MFSDSASTVYESFFYNEPGVVDEEYSLEVWITFKRPLDSLVHVRLTLPDDSALVRVVYDRSSVWNWEEEHYAVTGTLRIDSHQNGWISLKHDLVVVEKGEYGSTLRLRGERRINSGLLPGGWRGMRWVR